MHPIRMMKVLLPLVVWLTELITWIHCKGGIGFGIKREIFFLNIEDGYFGCQVNQSTDVLQLYELSRLCDGHQDCFQGSDELARELKCTNNCANEAGLRCQNGACLDSQCHCNDGFGGCSCEVPDENECKYRPCDIFAHCTNTLGSFHCSCYPGYIGDGFHCQDINECADPAIAGRCVLNAECCNVPAHFLCKCKPGFEGDGEIECRDINECALPGACGLNAVCRNYPGNYTCDCKEGYRGNPFTGCTDVDECQTNLCARGALCTNFPGGFHCECPPGTTGDAYHTGCLDIDECLTTNPCGINALCQNSLGSFQCICPSGYIGDPYHQCLGGEPLPGITCQHCPPGVPCNPETGACGKATCFTDVDCAINEVCLQGVCQLPCSAHNPCAQNAVCLNTPHGIDCSCVDGFQGNGFVGCLPARSYLPIPTPVCQYNEDCPPDKLCDRLNRICINPCSEDSCGENAVCHANNHKAECHCLPAFVGNAYLSCTSVTGCRSDNECAPNEACIGGKCGNPCRCGPYAVCDVIHHRATCKCLPGYSGNPSGGCHPPLNPCQPNPCGMHALCELDNNNPVCYCPKGMTGNPFKQCIPEGDECRPNPCGPNSGCRVVHGSAVCFCLPEFEGDPPITACHLPQHPCHPSPCGPNTQCTLTHDKYAKCTCLPGYIESPNTIRGCMEKRNPCDPNPCGFGAICDPNRSPCCFCPESTVGNPYKYCGAPVKSLCQPGPCGQYADCYITGNTEQCFCKTGYQGDPYTACRLIPTNPCYPNPCGPSATCTISHDGRPTCNCPPGIVLDPNGGCTGLECTVDEDCAFNRACVGYRCRDPCPGACGVGATCRVEKHHPVCTCNHGLTGNPVIRCSLIESQPERNPCMPNPCGPNTYCRISGKRAICSCIDNFIGDPRKGCRPECTLNSDCPSNKVCTKYQCKDPCSVNNVCGLGAICICRDHNPTCVCREGFAGNPFVQCSPKPEYPTYPNTTLPCTPNPCDPSSTCQVYGGEVAMCDPCSGPSAHYNPSCHPECLYNSDCPFNLACLSQKCSDPCPGSCGVNAHCTVIHHAPVCSCPDSLSGNPYEHCSPITHPVPSDHCHHDRCGANAICRNTQGHVTCECPPGYFGNPYLSCRPECVINTDCPPSKSCLNNKCTNPCHGVCGVKAQCQVINHQPVCYCPQDFTGDPFVNCYPNREYLPPTSMGKPGNPCDPSPCGPNSRCLISTQGFATCSCLPGYQGSPPLCKPECIVSTECPLTQSCVNQKCVNPCVGVCGVGAHCYVMNHNPICSCPAGHVGDPFVMCVLPPVEPVPTVPLNPCEPSPCGPNSVCQVREGHPVCSCLENYLGSPPYCRPECVMNQECPYNEACIHEKCRNPCTNSCGLNAKCDVVNHTPYCTCLPGYEGDAFVSCSKKPATVLPPIPSDPCAYSPCGENARCTVVSGAARCDCIPPYIGNPYTGACRPECVMNSDCSPNAACLSSHCRDPCPGVCGINAECTVVNHIPSCSCFPDHIGDPFQSCRRKPATPVVPINVCEPSPCGPNSHCLNNNGNAVCSCKQNFIGSPPNCRPECVVSAECNPSLACISQKCSDPCPGTCGLHARCTVINHNPICSCPPHTVGDPFVRCAPEEPRPPPIPANPCSPSPCGANSECQAIDGRPVCSCVIGMLGTPPYCRPECSIHADCPTKLACLNNKCRDPCIGSCGLNAQCTVINHQPVCSCLSGYQGDPFSACNPIPVVVPTPPPEPCVPSPCGPNAICKELHGAGSCTCLTGYFGDPYLGCRPECVQNSDCPWHKACVNNKCVDPCSGACGLYAECKVVHHSANCFCISGYTGNPVSACRKIPHDPIIHQHPCMRSPCGPYSQCHAVEDHAICACSPGYLGSPPHCHPECVSNADCPLDKSCNNQICSDPCRGVCGYNARCHVVNHNPICSCNAGYSGDPFVRCVEEIKPPIETRPQSNPCIPSPCGPSAICQVHGDVPSCSCLPNYIGRPPNCRPECTINTECEGNLACQNDRCIDPCPGSCGANSKCIVVHHTPVCTCVPGYTGDPFTVCSQVIEHVPTETPDPCHPSPCGSNAICKERNGAGSCQCLPEFTGDPYTGCRPECVLNGECPQDKACINNKCVNPCYGICGTNADCRVINHAPSCSCIIGYIGNPLVACHIEPKPAPKPERPRNPCIPSPCGPYSECRQVDGHAVCSCQNNYIGLPPACKPECMMSSECPQDKACIKQKCTDPCPGTCGLNARCQVVNHNPICSCSPGYSGDPFVRCLKESPPPLDDRHPTNPCIPSPCGPNSHCQVVGNSPACTCIENYIGRPPNCRPECTVNEECPPNLFCQNERCRDPCLGSCGPQTTCTVVKHIPLCNCINGYTGDPFAGCYPVPEVPQIEHPTDPCNPSPCGANAVCKAKNGAGSCICLPEYFGDPYTGCRPECVTNSDCDRNKACLNNKCKDPCPGTCGLNAECRVVNHAPSCSCLHGYIGDPISACHLVPSTEPPKPINPCLPSPCGPYSECRRVDNHAVCSCQKDYIGTPPSCRPECMVSSECALNKACINKKCADPCPGTCGPDARCQVVNHNPICSCSPGYTGDPFVRCIKEPPAEIPKEPINPCVPSPCGPNSECRVVGNTPACSCLQNYVGRPPNCRPECMINAECPGNLACQNDKCRDPCPGSCGIHAVCVVYNHAPQCTCENGFTGDPFVGCTHIPTPLVTEQPSNPCHPSPCGANAVCKERNGAGSCVCLPDYFGDPYTGCRPECVTNSDCDRSKACVNNKCKNPCPGTCGLHAECNVINHAPSCTCLPHYTGDATTACHPILEIEPEHKNPCMPSPCGPYSDCREINNHAVCSCKKNYVGSPPSCKPECIVSSECPQNKACINQKCADPCLGTCGQNARCQVVNHNPICSCPSGYTGDPFVRCLLEQRPTTEIVPSGNPCVPSPCGPNSECRVVGNTPACSCQSGYIGRPPNCRPECTINAECPGNLACQSEKCRDPCPGSCGAHTSCITINHAPQCTCEAGYTGDPFAGCVLQQITTTERPRNPCNPSPCGPNAVCKERNGAGSCVCLPEYFGDPYTGCRPECVTNEDCERSKACQNNKCRDPCPGTCGVHAECRVLNHAPSCFCLPGYTGNPLSVCTLIPSTTQTPVDPCNPSPCGPNSVCREVNKHAVCSCTIGFIGTPPSCRPECLISSECALDKACVNQKCVDPCPGTCGVNARCQVLTHKPICSCSVGYTGDPFVRCTKIESTTSAAPPENPCVPSPCGLYSQCRVINNTPACSCNANYIGAPPNCRPQCILQADCASNLACKNERCVDPCPGSCGTLALCHVINHNPVCTCPPGYTGNAIDSCQLEPTTERTPQVHDPCFPNPCGPNAECINKNEVAACRCLNGFFGDPYSGCKRECESNSDCGLPLACIGYKCVDPCPGTCGVEAICTTVNHIPICSCPPGYTGDPFFSCRPAPLTPKPPSVDPCYPSPCGPNSQCRAVNEQAVCTCLPNYIGNPPNCRPECVVSSECALDKACINQKCADPCPNTCGLYAICNVRNHNPFCTCAPQYTGDPFVQCSPIPITPSPAPTDAPPSCVPSPCGPNAQCKIVNGNPVCSCLPNFIGSPPSCRPECILSSECASQLACINQHCRDPCPGSCGVNANCHVVNHVPICQCNEGNTGDPFSSCSPIPITTPVPVNPCHPSPCGPNAICHGDGVCECLPEYTGNPYESCRPECVLSTECPRDKACIRNKCQNPCIGTCGQGANCDVINHIPVCSCPSDFVGDPFTLCKPKPPEAPISTNPCVPSPCGPNSVCRNNNGVPVCSCLPEYLGSPPACRPECITNEECSGMQACVHKKCVNPCVGVCGVGARCEVINHSPICSCREGQTGDPFRNCYDLPPPPPPEPKPNRNPCLPSPCGPNSQCSVVNELPSCSCLPEFIGVPPSCRPECLINGDCNRNLACINNKCKDPCPGSCGLNAVCQVISNTVTCSCQTGYVGNPFEQCVLQIHEEPANPCEPSPCGTNAECKQHNGAGSCSCIAGYHGNPYEECRPECVLSSDCPSDKTCIRNKCVDPCPGICGTYASCTVINHVPTCNCIPGYTGDPFSSCHPQPVAESPPQVANPCSPSPCGPNSKCVERNGQAVCSCLPEFQGSPPSCKPECVVNAECSTNRACHKFKCTDPCPGTCGVNARCEVIHHRPICSCPSGYTGDPFQRCYLALPEPKPPSPPPNPCVPSPCGPYSECHVAGSQASCRCKENYIGVPPHCRPECVVNTDCSPTLACISEKCRDPCPGSCGLNAKCSVQNHIPICTCLPDYTGDPFTQCSIIIAVEPSPKPNPCNPSPCGANANCNEGICTCIPNYFGDPYTGCRPECVMNTDCAPNKACVNQHCIDPCPGVCGQGARCDVVNHIPSCSCPPQTSGDAFVACRPIVSIDVDPCNPSPCGANSICRVSNGHAVCSCQPGLVGSPPSCKPECVVSAECALTQACLQNKCRDPCPGTCGLNAKCNVINHNPICSCPPGYNGDPFRQCQLAPDLPPERPKPTNPCVPSPCGPNAVCQVHGDTPACSCLPNYIGSPPNCRPECTINPECASNLACINQHCSDPCTGSCGFNAVCSVINHVAICSCTQGYTGDPFASCQLITAPPSPPPPSDPCYPSPCGPNARCQSENGVAACECLPEYQGNPYEGCRPECLISSDCIMNKACIKNKCQDPCPGTCGLSAICSVSNHIPICYCPEGTTGDAFRACEPITVSKEPPHRDPCVPSPCGPNTKCRVNNEIAVCECLPGFEGSPTTSGCHPECVINADCPRNKACMKNKCVDPCPGVCGYKAICQTLNHSPVCSCPPPLIGDPFFECKEAPAQPLDPCYPSPCGQNGHCRVINGIASCTYPECIINQDCSRDKACFGQKCRDPCVGACGINALCQVVNHDAVCSCPPGYYGEPKQQCRQELPPEPKPECYVNDDCSNDKACINQVCRDPCVETSNVCAANAECRVQQHRPYCFCKNGMTGNAQSFCYEIGCRADTDCIPEMACVNKECINPCMYTQCGTNSVCRVDSSHKGRCHCPDSYFGNPMVTCERPQCTSNSDCPPDLACVNQKCQSPCSCAHNALCNVVHHVPSCHCPPGYTGNPHQSCLLAPIEPSVECKADADCSSKLACFSGTCKSPCVETKPCGDHAECRVVDTLPLRTMTCHCLPGYVGDADVSCRKVPEKSAGCQNNDDCPYTDVCLNQQCIDPCTIRNPCAANAECQSANHKANCKCPPGLIGDPFSNCYKVSAALPECTVDSDCPSSRACINEKCQEPCSISNPCGVFAECNALQHRPVCHCPDGWAGNPQIHCYKPECKSDSDCLYDKACRNNNCISPCSSISCGIDAQCVVRAHVPQCTCPQGTQGNPLLSCVAVGCQYNEDCADHEACDRLNRKCRPVCERDTCAERAICSAKAHQPICVCPPGTHGDAYSECSESRTPISPECTKDSECPSKLACINQKCQNPCLQAGICSSDQECQVLDTYPVRTVMCVCPADSIATNDGHCKPIVALECKVDTDCRDTDRCVRGSCIEACRIDPCGLNALCNAKHHHSVCSCPQYYTGNPHIECTNVAIVPMPPTIPECVKDDDCPFNLGCHNQKCVSPCLIGDSCGRGSFCHVENHKPVCRCPVGYEGNPLTECRPPSSTQVVGCISNSDCSPDESCVNKLCVSPCNCGPNAECKVINHYPMCYCKPGYSGNPQISCIKVECESDEQCNYDKTCYNGNCVNPCILSDPCAVTAECYGDNHRATCKCPAGYSGDPFSRCEAVECQIDADCPQDRACVNQRCVNPCADTANPPCASNAICYVRNHATGCRCPDYLPVGNPLAYCERSAPPTSAEPECRIDSNCPSQLACINERCVNPCVELTPCSPSARCNVLDSAPLRTLTCTCPEGWISNKDGECKAVVVPKPPGCETNDDCSTNETCINRICRNPCNCGSNAQCFIQNHRPICSCKPGYEGNPHIACKLVGCRRDSECDSGRACINGNCVNPCIMKNPCGPNAECYAQGNTAQCQCASGYRGNPFERCHVVGCRSNNDCPDDRSCINAQCINPCIYEHPCAADAQCRIKNHIALCRCAPGMSGNPYTFCKEERKVECHEDSDCPSILACFNNKCQNPCTVLEPCERPANCEPVSTLPVRTMICMCPSGYISSGSGKCKPIPAITDVACTSDTQCPSDRACVNGVCKNPCNCGPNAECIVRNNKPICSCVPGYEGNPNLECIAAGCRSDDDCSSQNVCKNRACVPACAADGSSCGTDAVCYGVQHRAVCECPAGLTGNPQIACTYVTCKGDSDCPTDRACVNKKCVNPCAQSKDCVEPAVCVPYNHKADCSCPPGFSGDIATGCVSGRRGCRADSDCPSRMACINEKCVNPCEEPGPCGKGGICNLLDTTPVKTMICECPPGYEGNAVVECTPVSQCAVEKGLIKNEKGECVCPPNMALNINDECRKCLPEMGYKVDDTGHCVCALDRGLIINERGECVCPPEHGYELDYFGNCVPARPPGCESNDDCPDNKACENRKCVNPCESKTCGINAYCNATNHEAVCQCPPNYYGNPDVVCNGTARKDFPRPAEMIVSCLSDGVQVRMVMTDAGFNGVLYVKGHSKEEECRRLISVPQNAPSRVEIFKVLFGSCGLIHVNGQASFVLVIQKHPKLVTYKAQAYHIKCVYTTSEQNVTIGFNVSMLTTAGTIANTGPPPTCMMKIVTDSGREVNSAEIGENLVLQVDVHPTSIYGGFARSCVAKTLDNNVENEYIVTDENGCATDPSIFGEWQHDPDTQSLRAEFNAFKFPSSDNIRFQCNIRVCFGRCQPVNCRGFDAFGKRRKREISNRTDVDVLHEGQLREEITIESNAIFTIERREERLVNPTEEPQTAPVDDICISVIGLIVSLIITALLALVAVAVAVSCWLMAYRRQPSTAGPLPHPSELPAY